MARIKFARTFTVVLTVRVKLAILAPQASAKELFVRISMSVFSILAHLKFHLRNVRIFLVATIVLADRAILGQALPAAWPNVQI